MNPITIMMKVLSKEEKTSEIERLSTVKNEADMRPYKHFKKFYPVASLLRPIYIKKEQEKIERNEKK